MHEAYDAEMRNLAGGGRRVPSRLGIIGGGQLAKMTALAAARLGCDTVVLERNPFSPAARLSPASMVGDWHAPETLLEFASRADVITLENEFVNAEALEVLQWHGHSVLPTPSCLARVQDKLAQKEILQGAGLPVPAFRAVQSPQDILAAAEQLGWPLVLKTRRNGYDGKGNYTLRSAADVPLGWQKLRGDANSLLVEEFWPFVKELAVIVTRGRTGETAMYPVVETVQRDHVCRMVKAPAEVPAEVGQRAAALAVRAVEAVGAIGSFGVELFLAADGRLAINELAPRVHNSGHYSIEACECSQFENHVRAVLGWPLGSTALVQPAAVMINLLGDHRAPGWPSGWEQALRVPGAYVHLYGKPVSGPGRKMGHVTALGATPAEALAKAERAAACLEFKNNL